jgi:hypothetical protein
VAGHEPTGPLSSIFHSYLVKETPFDEVSGFWELVADMKRQALRENRTPNAVALWERFSTPETEEFCFVARVLHSVCPNAASNEREFSQYGRIHNKHRANLDAAKVADIAKVKRNLRAKQRAEKIGEISGKRKRMDEPPAPARALPRPRLDPERPPVPPRLDLNLENPFPGDLQLLNEEEFQREALGWMADLTAQEADEDNDDAAWDQSLSIPLHELFNWESGLVFDNAVLDASRFLGQEEDLLEALMDPLPNQAAEINPELYQEQQAVARAVNGQDDHNPLFQSIADALDGPA